MKMLKTFRCLVAVLLLAGIASPAMAASTMSWDGTWTGAWGGDAAQATSITIAGGKVVSFSYQGASTPVTASTVTARRVSYSNQDSSVVMIRTGKNSATAKLHTGQGQDTSARLKRE